MAAAQIAAALHEDFVRTARAKGVRGTRVPAPRAPRRGARRVVALIGVNMNLVLTNLALVEIVFNIPGGYRYLERALVNRDIDLVQALVRGGDVLHRRRRTSSPTRSRAGWTRASARARPALTAQAAAACSAQSRYRRQ